MSNLGGKKVSADTEGTGGPAGATGPAGPTTNTTKGDLEGFSTVAARIPVGTDGQHLEADSTQALGLKWATPSVGSSDTMMYFHSGTAKDPLYSSSSFAAKGITFNCIAGATVFAVQVESNTASSATYQMVIAEVSGASDTVDAITATSSVTPTTAIVTPIKEFLFPAGVTLVSGKRYSFIVVRTEGTGTTACVISYPTSAPKPSNSVLEYVASSRIADTTISVSDVLRLDTSLVMHIALYYTID